MHQAILTWLFALSAMDAFEPPLLWADHFNLELGATTSGNFPMTPPGNGDYFGIGLIGRASYELTNWSFGVQSRGMIATSAPINLPAESFKIAGTVPRREAALGILIRHFLEHRPQDNPVYVEGGAWVVQNEFLRANQIVQISTPINDMRVFAEGFGGSLGLGSRIKDTRCFFQFNYEFQIYKRAQIVGTPALLNQVEFEPHIEGDYIVHTIFLTFGISLVP